MKEIILELIDSNLLAVFLGGAISLVSVCVIELLKSSKEKKLRKLKVFQDIKATTKLTYRYIILDTQMDIFHAYHKRMKELTNEKYHEDEAQRRLLQLEEFKLKTLSFEAEWNRAVASYHAAFGTDAGFNEHVKLFDEWDIPTGYDYSNINDQETLKQKRDDDVTQAIQDIDDTLKPICDDLVKHIKNKL